ncbi:MAG: glutaredoxin 3 [Alphaproteobacteria bacterium]|nr:glutaredoxin 3 [Alphaproteobacteria bacterium]
MSDVTIYTSILCPYCVRAKALLKRKGATITEIDVSCDRALRAEMESRSGRHTVPQIFIGERHVGGCDDLHALEARGELDRLLSSTA